MRLVKIWLTAVILLLQPTGALALSDTDSTGVSSLVCGTPVAPNISSPASSDTTASSVVVSGTAEGLSTVTIYRGGSSVGTVATPASGSFSLSVALNYGVNQIKARSDVGCGSTPDSNLVNVTRKPNAPNITSPDDLTTTTNASITVSGTADPNLTVDIFRNGTVVATLTSTAEGTFSASASLALGSNDIYATSSAGGATSAPSLVVRVFRDTPASPPPGGPPVITIPADQTSTTATSIGVEGVAEAGSSVKIYVGGNVAATITAADDGSFAATVNLSIGENQIYATATTEGGTSEPSNTVRVIRNQLPPSTPLISSPAAGTAVSSSRINVSGVADPGVTVKIILNGNEVASVVADDRGHYSAQISLTEGTNSIKVVAINAAGSTESTTVTVTYRPGIVGAIVNTASQVATSVREAAGRVGEAFVGAIESVVEPITDSDVATGITLATGGGAAVISGGIGLLPLLIQYGVTFLLQLMGLKRKNMPWGMVYDSVTKKPLAFVRVELFGPTFQSVVTGPDGRFGFNVTPGNYEIRAKREGYKFPGQVPLLERGSNYVGGQFEVATDAIINVRIPLDPTVKTGSARFAVYGFGKLFSWLILTLSVGVGFYLFILDRRPLMLGLAVFYALALALNVWLTLSRPKAKWGMVRDSKGQAVPGVVVNLYKTEDGSYVDARRTDSKGFYSFFAPKGQYLLRVDAKDYFFKDKLVQAKTRRPYISAKLVGQKLSSASTFSTHPGMVIARPLGLTGGGILPQTQAGYDSMKGGLKE